MRRCKRHIITCEYAPQMGGVGDCEFRCDYAVALAQFAFEDEKPCSIRSLLDGVVSAGWV